MIITSVLLIEELIGSLDNVVKMSQVLQGCHPHQGKDRIGQSALQNISMYSLHHVDVYIG